MDHITSAIVAALAAASGRIVRVVYNTLPTTDAERASRERAVAKRAVDGAMIARVAAVDTATDGTAVVVLAGRYDAKRGAVRAKNGTDTIGLILSAPAEHTIGGALVPTACPNAGREGTACATLAPRHGHRSLRTDRIVSISVGDTTLYDATA